MAFPATVQREMGYALFLAQSGKTPFIVPYRLKRNIIQILRTYYGALRWPESF
jgi:hypothetical protein